jgi:uncharacterized membrane protein
MAPMNTVAHARWTTGSNLLRRFNGLPAQQIVGTGGPGVSSGAAMQEIARLQDDLGGGFTLAWSGLSYQQQVAANQAPALFAASILFIFLCLAALYESWSVPFSVMLVIPLGIIGAVLAATLRGLSNDIFFQVALLTTIGLSAKNAILIIEFAEAALGRGLSPLAAALEAARLRFRPIVMTSVAFIAGVVPLVLARGAGANGRQAIGTTVLGGMISATVLAVFFVPLFFIVVKGWFARTKKPGCPRRARHEPFPRPDGGHPHRAWRMQHGACLCAPGPARSRYPPARESYPVLPQADGAIDAIGWNTFFTDARLRKVIADALANNRDLRASIANVAVARAQYRGTHAAELPTITAVPRPAAIAAPSRRADM